MGINTNSIQDYLTWRNGLTEADYVGIYNNLGRLDKIEQLVIEEGADHDTIRRAVFELD